MPMQCLASSIVILGCCGCLMSYIIHAQSRTNDSLLRVIGPVGILISQGNAWLAVD